MLDRTTRSFLVAALSLLAAMTSAACRSTPLVTVFHEPVHFDRRTGDFSANVTGTLADPVLNVFDANNNLLFTNDNVADAPLQSAITGFTGVSFTTTESGVLLVLPPGGYTGIVSGAGDTTGVGLAEAFEVSW